MAARRAPVGDWGASEVTHSPGFGYPTYCQNFLKEHTSTTPLAFCRAQVPAAD